MEVNVAAIAATVPTPTTAPDAAPVAVLVVDDKSDAGGSSGACGTGGGWGTSLTGAARVAVPDNFVAPAAAMPTVEELTLAALSLDGGGPALLFVVLKGAPIIESRFLPAAPRLMKDEEDEEQLNSSRASFWHESVVFVFGGGASRLVL